MVAYHQPLNYDKSLLVLGAEMVENDTAIDIGPILNETGGITDTDASLQPYEEVIQSALAEITAYAKPEAELVTA